MPTYDGGGHFSEVKNNVFHGLIFGQCLPSLERLYLSLGHATIFEITSTDRLVTNFPKLKSIQISEQDFNPDMDCQLLYELFRDFDIFVVFVLVEKQNVFEDFLLVTDLSTYELYCTIKSKYSELHENNINEHSY